MATGTILAPAHLTATTTLADLTTAVGTGKVRRYDLRVANIGSADANIDIYLVDTATGANSHYRAKTYPVPYNNANSAPDLESALLLTANWKIQVRASVAATLECSATGVEDDA